MEVGRYYFKQRSYLAGINRFKRVVTEYRNTSQTPEALYRLTEGYMALGIVSEAQTAASCLKLTAEDLVGLGIVDEIGLGEHHRRLGARVERQHELSLQATRARG
jgi:hypothetical protein